MKNQLFFGILFAAVLAVVYSDERGICLKKTTLDEAKIAELEGKDEIPAGNEEFFKFKECFFRELGVINNDEIDYDKFKELSLEKLKAKLETDPRVSVELLTNIVNEAFRLCKEEHFEGSLGEQGVKVKNCVGNNIQKGPALLQKS